MARTTIPAELVAINAIQGTLIADNAITAVHIATNAVSGTLVADNAITSTHIAQNNVTATQIAMNTITVTQMADNAVETAKINNDAVTQAKIADDAVGADQLASNSVTSASIVNGTIVAADLADNAVTLAKMASLARGKIIYGDSAGDPAALAVGSNGTVLKSDGTDISWGAESTFDTDAAQVFNESGAAVDFRIEGDTAQNLFFVDGSADKIGISNNAPKALIHIGTLTGGDATAQEMLRISGDYSDTNSGALIRFTNQHDSGTNPNSGEYNLAGIKAFDFRSDWGGAIALQTAPNTSAGGNLTDRLVINPEGYVGIGTSDPKSTLQVEGGRMGIISTDSSWEQLRIANSNVAEVGIALLNGATNTEFLSDSVPSFSNAFTLAINPYGVGTDTLAIGHGNLGDSIWHIDGSGNFGYGPNTENPLTYYEISKTRPNVNAPADYELKLTLNTYGYVGSGYKLAMIQFVGGDTASAQDNFYAGISARAVNGANNSEDGALEFHVESDEDTDTLAVEINGEHNTGSQIAGSGSTRNGMLFHWQGIAIDRSWANYPGIAVMNSSAYSTTASTQAEFRVHGTNGANTSYPGTSGSDFSVDFRVDGAYQTGSDRRRKKNITTISNALSTVKQLTGKKFQIVNRADEVQETASKNGYKFGFIAQDVESIIPETVKYNANEDDGTENWNSAYSLDYGSLTALLVNAIKEQDTVIQDLKSRIETLEG